MTISRCARPILSPRSTRRLQGRFAPAGSTSMSKSRWRRCSSRCGCARWNSPTARWCRRCACIRPRRACPAIFIWCITARARSAAPGLIFTEMTCVSRDARITPGCAGLVERRAGGRVAAHRRFRPCQFGGEDRAAARPCRPQGRHQTDVGRHGPAAGAGRLGRRVGVADSLFSRQPGAARDGPRGDGCGQGRRSSRPPNAASAAASTCWNCTAPTAICWRVLSRR